MNSILDRHRERFQAAPGDNRAFEALEEHLFLAGEWDEVIALYEHRLNAPALQANPEQRAHVLFRLGQVWQDRRKDADRARAYYSQVLGIDPGHRAALGHLRQIHAGRGQWDVALQIAEAEVALPMRPDEQAALHADMGTIWLDHLDDAEQSISYFERALEVHPEHAEALDGMARALEATSRLAESAKAWERLTQILRGADRARALVSVAKLYAGPLQQPDAAVDRHRRALTDDPRNPDAVEAVAQHAAAREQWDLLADLQERRFELAVEDARRAEIAVETARLYVGHLDNPGAARMWFGRARDLDPDDPDLYEAMAELEREHGTEASLLQCLERILELRSDVSVEVLLEISTLFAGPDADRRVLEVLERAREIAPDDVRVVNALADTLARAGRDEERIEILERRAALAGPDAAEQSSALAELGQLHEERIGDMDAATDAYRRAFDASPLALGVARSLERLYRKAENWTELRAVLETAGRQGPDEERVSFLCSLGALLTSAFDEPQRAVKALEAALVIDPTADAAHRGLQHLASVAGDDDAVLRIYEREASITTDRSRLAFLVAELRRILESRGDFEAALGWVDRWAGAAPEDTTALYARAHLLEKLERGDDLVATLTRLGPLLQGEALAEVRRRIGTAHAAADRVDEAIACFEDALEADPRDMKALEGLIDVLERANRPSDVARAKRWLIDLLPVERRLDCLIELADLLGDRLGDVSGAIDALKRVAEDFPEHPGIDERLEALLDRGARWEELVAHLLRRTSSLPDGSEAANAIELRRARILVEHLERPDEAVKTYREIRTHDGDTAEAREGLERALRASDDVAGLAVFLGEQVERGVDAETRDHYAFERAVLLEEVLGQNAEAREAYRSLSRSAADSERRDQARVRLGALLERTADWAGMREHLGTLVGTGTADEDRDLHERLGRLCTEHLDDPSGAIDHFEAAARLAPNRADLWRTLSGLYEATDRTDALLPALEMELATRPGEDRELALRSRAGEICLRVLEDPARARAQYERVLELDPSHATAAAFLMELWEREERFDAMVEHLEARLTTLDAEPRDDDGRWATQRTSLRLRIAGLRSSKLDDLDGAIAALEPALGELGPEPAIAEPLADLYQRAEYGEDYLELCRRAANACQVPAERAIWQVRVGDALTRVERDSEAAEAYRRALADGPDDRDVQASLRDVLRRLGEHEPLTLLLEAELSRISGPDEIPVRSELARVLADSLARPGDALDHLRRILQLDPAHVDAIDQALELAELLGRNEMSLELLDAALARPLAPPARAALLARRGDLLAGGGTVGEDAAAAYRESLELDPSHSRVRDALCSFLEGQGRWSALLDCLYQDAVGSTPDVRARLFERAADTAAQQLSLDASLPWLERLRRERPDDAEVCARVAAVHRTAGRHAALLRALDEQIDLIGEAVADARDLHVERAVILETELGSPARAVAAFEAARHCAPEDASILRELERLYRGMQRPRERAEVLEALIEVADDHERITHLCDVAALYTGSLVEPGRGADHLRTAVELAPPQGSMYAELLHALGDALAAAGRASEWAACAERELEALDAGSTVFRDRRAELHRELARTYEHELGRPAAALTHLRALVDGGPTAGESEAEFEAAEFALLRLLRSDGNAIELEERLAIHLERRDHAAPETWLELARLRDERLHAPAAALSAYRRVLESVPDSRAAICGLRAAAERVGAWPEVTDMLERELEQAGEKTPQERAALLRRLGDVQWRRLNLTTRASRSYAAAIEAWPRNFGALRALQRLLETMEDWRGALDLYESEVEVLGDSDAERRCEALLRAGELARDRVGEPERALRAYESAAALGPLPTPRLRELAALQESCGRSEAFTETFAAWCDAEDSCARAVDHERLAAALEEQGREEDARDRIERALAIDGESVAAWDLAARLREAAGDAAGAATALERAAERSTDNEAAARLLRGAELCEGGDPERAESLLRAAARRDAGSAAVQAGLTRICFALGDFQDAVHAAGQALDLDAAAVEKLAQGVLVETAVCGARAARERGRYEEAARLYTQALAVDSAHPIALGEQGETLAALGDLTGAREALEARLDQDDSYPERALHLTIVGRSLEEAGDAEAARERFEAALAGDPDHPQARAALLSLHESAQRVDDGVACLVRWAESSSDAEERAAQLVRAAAWEMRAGDREESAERNLRAALEAEPGRADAALALGELLAGANRSEEALAVLDPTGSDATDDDRAAIALARAHLLEVEGDRAAAVEAYRVAAEADPSSPEAVRSQARLLRALGQWQAAADALRTFAEAPGDPARPGRVDALLQLGRLLAGPLEDAESAIDIYRRAVIIDPEVTEARTALAELLTLRESDRDEALLHHVALLDDNPTHAPSLRGVLKIAESRGRESALARGQAILSALGISPRLDAAPADAATGGGIAGDRSLSEPIFEKLRRVAHAARDEIAEALESSPAPEADAITDPGSAFRAAVLRTAGELSAPALLPLPNASVCEVMTLIASLVLDPDGVHGDGRQVNALSSALKRRTRRKLRRLLDGTSAEEISAVDFAAWRSDLRGLAAAVALDDAELDLRAALVLLALDSADAGDAASVEADVSELVAAAPEARALLHRAVHAWLVEL